MLSGMTAIERMHGKARRRFVQPPDSSGGAAGMGGAATLRAPDGQHRPAGAFVPGPPGERRDRSGACDL